MNVLVAGDYCPTGRVDNLILNGEGVLVLEGVKDIVSSVDFSIVNFECTIPTSSSKPISKVGPNLRCDEKSVDVLKWAGFKCATLANNHFLDYGEDGVNNTIKVLKSKGLDVVGGGSGIKEASTILYKRIDNELLAIINCCEHEFSIAGDNAAGSNPLNPIKQFYEILEAKTKADYVLVIVHGGNEFYQLPSPRMKEVYRFFIDVGADAVVNHHQHCYSGYEVYKSKPIFYGLGNFCFDSIGAGKGAWNEGYMVALETSNNHFTMLPYRQCDESPSVILMNESEKEVFMESIDKINATIEDDNLLEEKYNNYIGENSDLREVFAPFSGRVASFLFRNKLIPGFMTQKKRQLLLAYIQCESHYPKVLKYLNRQE